MTLVASDINNIVIVYVLTYLLTRKKSSVVEDFVDSVRSKLITV